MSVNHGGAIRPIALQPGEGEALWFMGMLATVKASIEGTDGVVAVIEHRDPNTRVRRFIFITMKMNGSTCSRAN